MTARIYPCESEAWHCGKDVVPDESTVHNYRTWVKIFVILLLTIEFLSAVVRTIDNDVCRRSSVQVNICRRIWRSSAAACDMWCFVNLQIRNHGSRTSPGTKGKKKMRQ